MCVCARVGACVCVCPWECLCAISRDGRCAVPHSSVASWPVARAGAPQCRRCTGFSLERLRPSWPWRDPTASSPPTGPPPSPPHSPPSRHRACSSACPPPPHYPRAWQILACAACLHASVLKPVAFARGLRVCALLLTSLRPACAHSACPCLVRCSPAVLACQSGPDTSHVPAECPAGCAPCCPSAPMRHVNELLLCRMSDQRGAPHPMHALWQGGGPCRCAARACALCPCVPDPSPAWRMPTACKRMRLMRSGSCARAAFSLLHARTALRPTYALCIAFHTHALAGCPSTRPSATTPLPRCAPVCAAASLTCVLPLPSRGPGFRSQELLLVAGQSCVWGGDSSAPGGCVRGGLKSTRGLCACRIEKHQAAVCLQD